MALPNDAMKGISPLAAASLSGGLNLAGGILNVGSQLLINKQNINHQLDMFNMTNSYNHPAEQMKRYVEAGLNPNLIYGQTNTASPVSLGISQPPNFDFLAQTGRDILSSYYTREHSFWDKMLKSAKYLIDEWDGYVKQTTSQNEVTISDNKKEFSEYEVKKIKADVDTAIELAEQGKIDTAIKELQKTAVENEMKLDFNNTLMENFPNMKPGLRLFLSGLFNILDFLGGNVGSIIGMISKIK